MPKKSEKLLYVNVYKKKMFHVNIYRLFLFSFLSFFSKRVCLR